MTTFFATDPDGRLRLWHPPGDPQQLADDLERVLPFLPPGVDPERTARLHGLARWLKECGG